MLQIAALSLDTSVFAFSGSQLKTRHVAPIALSPFVKSIIKRAVVVFEWLKSLRPSGDDLEFDSLVFQKLDFGYMGSRGITPLTIFQWLR